jgi:hypothetical protein
MIKIIYFIKKQYGYQKTLNLMLIFESVEKVAKTHTKELLTEK